MRNVENNYVQYLRNMIQQLLEMQANKSKEVNHKFDELEWEGLILTKQKEDRDTEPKTLMLRLLNH